MDSNTNMGAAGVPENQNMDNMPEMNDSFGAMPMRETKIEESMVESVAAPVGNMTMSVAEKKAGGKGMLIGMIVLIILAAGGIGFGVWAILSGNSRTASLNEQVETLTQENNALVERINQNIQTGGYINPILKSDNESESFHERFVSSPVWSSDGSARVVEISVLGGGIEYCNVSSVQWLENGGKIFNKVGDCNIEGLTGSIYDVIEFGIGQDSANNQIGFITTDGTVQYLPLYASVENSNFAIAGELSFDGGAVVNAVEMEVTPTDAETGAYTTTAFALSSGDFVKFDTSMLP